MSSDEAARILGVPVDAKSAELNKAWRKLARTCHPDLHPGDKRAENRFRKLNSAFDILSRIQESTRRQRSMEEAILENEFDIWITQLDPKKQEQIRRELEELEEKDES